MNDKELLDYLMTSDMSEELKPDELKNMILFFRNHVRKVNGSNNSLQYKIEELERKLEYRQLVCNKLTSNTKQAEMKLEKALNKKLSWKERLFGNLKK